MALPVGTYVYEFFYRGRSSDSLTIPDFYVILGVAGTDVFGNPTTAYLGPMPPTAAAALGVSPIGPALTVYNGIQAQMAAVNAAIAAYNTALAANPGLSVPVLTLTQPTGVYVYEFLYRGGAAADWSVVLAQSTTDLFGNPMTAYAGPLTPAKASSLTGLTLATAIAGINAVTQLQINSINAAIAAMQAGP